MLEPADGKIDGLPRSCGGERRGIHGEGSELYVRGCSGAIELELLTRAEAQRASSSVTVPGTYVTEDRLRAPFGST